MASKLEQLREMTVVVADTGDLEAVRRLKPQDCTTNPSLVLKAIQNPAMGEHIARAVDKGRHSEDPLETIAQELTVGLGVELAGIVPGRVSTEVDAKLSFDTEASMAKAHSIVEAYDRQGVGRDRILIKLASTWEGIRAAEKLEREGIQCNLTLLFSMAQAKACADAGVFLISPFVGRILDWHVKAGGGPFTGETDPGVLSVRRIYASYKAQGIGTVVMGASFRNIGEIEALAGCDRLTISPALLDELAKDSGSLPRKLSPDAVERVSAPPRTDEKSFRYALNEDAMATEKLAEGIRSFVKDLRGLRTLVAKRLESKEAA